MRFWIAIVVGAMLLGCDARHEIESPAALPREIPGSGIIRGEVKFTGTPPTMQTIDNRSCYPGVEPITEEYVIVNDNGTLRNVLVYLEDAPETDGSAAEPAVLDQVNCRYVPHVLGVQTGQKLLIRSSDPTLHNVHCLSRKNRAFNFGMTGAKQERAVSFTAHEFVTLKCDVHPWMTAYVGVFENPWYAVTDEYGRFRIDGIPAGSYKLVTWHERYGRLERDVVVSDDEQVDAHFEYKSSAVRG